MSTCFNKFCLQLLIKIGHVYVYFSYENVVLKNAELCPILAEFFSKNLQTNRFGTWQQ
jgi:hypothetical protein